MFRPRIRLIESAIDIKTLTEISAEELLDFDVGRHTRKAADNQKTTEFPIVCKKCENPVIVPMHWRTKEYHFQHVGQNVDCPWTAENGISVDAASAQIFGGRQEGPLHERIKMEVGKLIAGFPDTQECWVDQYFTNGAGKRRKPDLRFITKHQHFVIEIQLATTQRPIITARNQFYAIEKIPLIWVTWRPNRAALQMHKASVIDIITDHNDNLFSVDEETLRLSRDSGELKLRVHWWDNLGCYEKIVSLFELTHPEDGLPYAVEKPLEWHEKFKEDWIESHNGKSIPYQTRCELWSTLLSKIDPLATDLPSSPEWDGVALINVLLSLERSKVIGSDQKNLTEVLHTHFTTASRKPTSHIVAHAAKKAGHGSLLEKPTTFALLKTARLEVQVAKTSWQTSIVRCLFPGWSEKSKN